MNEKNEPNEDMNVRRVHGIIWRELSRAARALVAHARDPAAFLCHHGDLADPVSHRVVPALVVEKPRPCRT
jgi:hypothetical protein